MADLHPVKPPDRQPRSHLRPPNGPKLRAPAFADEPSGRVLVVDDEPAVVGTLRERLERLSYAVATAGTFDEARAAMAAFAPHVVIIDFRMRGTAGLKRLREFRAQHPAVIWMVVPANTYDNSRAIDAGFFVLRNPLSVSVLRWHVRHAMRVALQGEAE